MNQTITRQEMAVMASKFAAQYKDGGPAPLRTWPVTPMPGDSWASESWALSSGDGRRWTASCPQEHGEPSQHGGCGGAAV